MAKSDPGQGAKAQPETREQRLAKALRTNLQRRKSPKASVAPSSGCKASEQ
jgi:hypothetical protein